MICEHCKKLAEFDFAISTLKRLHGEASDCSAPFCDGDEIKEYYLWLNKRFKEKKDCWPAEYLEKFVIDL